MTPTSKWMRFVSVNTPNIDFTKDGPTDGNLPEERAASIELGGGTSGVEPIRSCNAPSLTIALCQLCNVATSRCHCCWVATAPGPLTPLPRRRAPDIPARGPRTESRRQVPICCQSGSGIKSSYPRASRPYGGQPPLAQQCKEPNANFRDRHRPWKTKRPTHVLGAMHEFLT